MLLLPHIEFEVFLHSEKELEEITAKIKQTGIIVKPFENDARRYYSVSGKITDKDLAEKVLSVIKQFLEEEILYLNLKIVSPSREHCKETIKELIAADWEDFFPDKKNGLYHIELKINTKEEGEKILSIMAKLLPALIACVHFNSVKARYCVPALKEMSAKNKEKILEILKKKIKKIKNLSNFAEVSDKYIAIVNFADWCKETAKQTKMEVKKAIIGTLEESL